MDSIDTLARTIWGEARGEGHDGMVAVACVVLNRVAKPGWWGKSIVGVCLCADQFDCWLPDDPNLAKLRAVDDTDLSFADALSIAAIAIAGKLIDTTAGSTYYYALSMPKPPYWAAGKKPAVIIGRQAFYNNIN